MRTWKKCALSLAILLLICSCKFPGAHSDGQLPRDLDIDLSFTQVPSLDGRAMLSWDITVTGDQGYPFMNGYGDTLDYLWIYHHSNPSTPILDANPDSLWHGPITLGQKIHLEIDYGSTHNDSINCCTAGFESGYACHVIYLMVAYVPDPIQLGDLVFWREEAEASAYGPHTWAILHYNHVTGNYKYESPYLVEKGSGSRR